VASRPKPDNRAERPSAQTAGPSLRWAGLLLALATLVQLRIRSPLDTDTYYHFAVGRLIREHGLLQAFPWTPFSWLAEHYSDKELLLHLLLAPVSDLGLIWGSRVVGALLAGTVLITLLVVADREKVLGAGVWVLIVLLSSGSFLFRLFAVRPHLLSIPLALLCLWAATRRHWVLLAIVGFLYPLSYTAWHLPIVLVVLVEVSRLTAGRRPEWKPFALLLGAIALGLVVHPNFPRNLELFWIQNFTVLFQVAWGGAGGFDLGMEFDPFGLGDYLRHAAIPTLFAGAAATRAWRRRADEPVLWSFALAALAFVVITTRTARFIEYLAPFAGLALALSMKSTRAANRWGLLAGCVVCLLLFGTRPLEIMANRRYEFPPAVADELRQAIPEGAQVVTCDWGATGGMLLELPERRFLVALDPVFFWVQSPDLYRTWYETVHDPPANAGAVLRDAFDAQYVVCDVRAKWKPIHEALLRDPSVQPRAAPGIWRVYALRQSAYDPPSS
jgi:hypothetical protein